MQPMKQPAITKHPKGTASFYLRVAWPSGGTMEQCTERALPVEELLTYLEEQIAMVRRACAKDKGATDPAIGKSSDGSQATGSA
jgi:hypothetical protein